MYKKAKNKLTEILFGIGWFILKNLPDFLSLNKIKIKFISRFIFKLRICFLNLFDNFNINNKVTIYRKVNFSFFSKIKIDHLTQIRSGVSFSFGKMTIGTGCRVGENSYFDISGGLKIENYVFIAKDCKIFTHQHFIAEEQKKLINQDEVKMPVKLSNDVFLYEEVAIMPGVFLPERVIVAFRSLITKKTYNSNYLYAGIPAKQIKKI